MSDLAILPRHVVHAGNQVWVVDDQSTLRNRQVTTLRTAGEELYISSGLQDGDLVALTLVDDALPGMTVEIGERKSSLRPERLMEAAGTAGESNPEAVPETIPDTVPDQTSTDGSATDETRTVTAA